MISLRNWARQVLLGVGLAASFALSSADAAPTSLEGFVGRPISAIDVRGLKRIEKDAVLNKIANKVNDKLERDKIRADIQGLFGMGYFDDLSVEAEEQDSGKVKLIYVFKERPVISKIEFDGNEQLNTDDLKDVVKVKQWSILDINKVREDMGLLQKHYEEKGFYLTKINYSIKTVKPDEVELTYKITDYDKVQIRKITFLNNKAFSDSELKTVLMETKEGGLLSGLSSSGNFKESSFKQDLQRLTYWYLDHGYVRFKYDNPVVTVSDDKKSVFISVYVEEGDQYNIGKVDFSGDLLFPKEEFHNDITLKEKDLFSITKRNNDIQKLTEKYQDLGFAFVNVIPKMDIKDDTKIVDIEYSYEKGNLAYFGKIDIVGNAKTHDKVIRRELKIKEGELFHGTRLRQSKENVERLGFFAPGEVIFNQSTPKGRNDVVNIEIQIKERSTGTITLGAGYGSVQKFFFQTQVSEINLLGRGQQISLSMQYAADRVSRSFSFGFTDPYVFDTLWSAGFDLFYVTYPIPDLYFARKVGGDVRLGHPVMEYTNFFTTYKNELLKITDKANPDVDTSLDEGTLSSVVFSVVRDKRNNRFEPTEGNYQSVSWETAGVTGLGGDKQFMKYGVNNRYYQALVGDLVFRNSTEFGHIFRAGSKDTPPSERFFLGGPSNMKGYEVFSLTPRRVTKGGFVEKTGGAVQAFSLFELEYPLIKQAGIKWVLFYDAGNTFSRLPVATDEPLLVRTDWGFGLRWFSPIGPLRFEWGFPFRRRPDESSPVFQFFIGPPF